MDSFDFQLFPVDPDAAVPSLEKRARKPLNPELLAAAESPGWLESSRDLARGLTVTEGLLAELAWKEWLVFCRRG